MHLESFYNNRFILLLHNLQPSFNPTGRERERETMNSKVMDLIPSIPYTDGEGMSVHRFESTQRRFWIVWRRQYTLNVELSLGALKSLSFLSALEVLKLIL